MATGVRTGTMTAEELRRLASGTHRYELIRGELRTMEPTGFGHGTVTAHVGFLLRQHVRAHGLGETTGAETGFLLSSDPDTVRAPDAAFVARERVEAAGTVDGYWHGAPDLAVEVLSPSDSYTEVEEKALEWLASGARMVIALDPRRRSATVYRSASRIVVLSEDEQLDAADIVSGWRLPVGALFE